MFQLAAKSDESPNVILVDDSLVVDYDTPHTMFRLPPLTLQPIMENAVRHGRPPMRVRCTFPYARERRIQAARSSSRMTAAAFNPPTTANRIPRLITFDKGLK